MSARPQGTRTPAKGTFSRVHKGMVRAALPPERAREGVPNPIIPTWPHSGPAGEAPRASPGDITDILNSAFEILSQHGPGAGRDLRRTRIVPTEPTRFSLSDSGRLGYASRSPMPYTVLGKEAERSPTYMHSTQSRVGLDFIRPDSRSPDVSATAHRRTRSPTQSRSKSKSKTESRSPPRSKSTRQREVDILKSKLTEAMVHIQNQHATIAHQNSLLKHAQGAVSTAKKTLLEKETEMQQLRDRAADMARILESVAVRSSNHEALSEQELSQVSLLLHTILEQFELDNALLASSLPLSSPGRRSLSPPKATPAPPVPPAISTGGTPTSSSSPLAPRVTSPVRSPWSGKPIRGVTPDAGRAVVTAIGADVPRQPDCEVYLSMALVGHRNPPAVTAPVPCKPSDTFVMWSKRDNPTQSLLFANITGSGSLTLSIEVWRRTERKDEFIGRGESPLDDILRGIAVDSKLPVSLLDAVGADAGAVIVDVKILPEALDAVPVDKADEVLAKNPLKTSPKPSVSTITMEVPVGRVDDDIVLPVTIVRASKLPLRPNGMRPDAYVRLAVVGDRLDGGNSRSVWDRPSAPQPSPSPHPLELLVEVWDRMSPGSTFIGRGSLGLDARSLEPSSSLFASSPPFHPDVEQKCRVFDASGASAGVVTLVLGRVQIKAKKAPQPSQDTLIELQRRLVQERATRESSPPPPPPPSNPPSGKSPSVPSPSDALSLFETSTSPPTVPALAFPSGIDRFSCGQSSPSVSIASPLRSSAPNTPSPRVTPKGAVVLAGVDVTTPSGLAASVLATKALMGSPVSSQVTPKRPSSLGAPSPLNGTDTSSPKRSSQSQLVSLPPANALQQLLAAVAVPLNGTPPRPPVAPSSVSPSGSTAVVADEPTFMVRPGTPPASPPMNAVRVVDPMLPTADGVKPEPESLPPLFEPPSVPDSVLAAVLTEVEPSAPSEMGDSPSNAPLDARRTPVGSPAFLAPLIGPPVAIPLPVNAVADVAKGTDSEPAPTPANPLPAPLVVAVSAVPADAVTPFPSSIDSSAPVNDAGALTVDVLPPVTTSAPVIGTSTPGSATVGGVDSPTVNVATPTAGVPSPVVDVGTPTATAASLVSIASPTVDVGTPTVGIATIGEGASPSVHVATPTVGITSVAGIASPTVHVATPKADDAAAVATPTADLASPTAGVATPLASTATLVADLASPAAGVLAHVTDAVGAVDDGDALVDDAAASAADVAATSSESVVVDTDSLAMNASAPTVGDVEPPAKADAPVIDDASAVDPAVPLTAAEGDVAEPASAVSVSDSSASVVDVPSSTVVDADAPAAPVSASDAPVVDVDEKPQETRKPSLSLPQTLAKPTMSMGTSAAIVSLAASLPHPPPKPVMFEVKLPPKLGVSPTATGGAQGATSPPGVVLPVLPKISLPKIEVPVVGGTGGAVIPKIGVPSKPIAPPPSAAAPGRPAIAVLAPPRPAVKPITISINKPLAPPTVAAVEPKPTAVVPSASLSPAAAPTVDVKPAASSTTVTPLKPSPMAAPSDVKPAASSTTVTPLKPSPTAALSEANPAPRPSAAKPMSFVPSVRPSVPSNTAGNSFPRPQSGPQTGSKFPRPTTATSAPTTGSTTPSSPPGTAPAPAAVVPVVDAPPSPAPASVNPPAPAIVKTAPVTVEKPPIPPPDMDPPIAQPPPVPSEKTATPGAAQRMKPVLLASMSARVLGSVKSDIAKSGVQQPLVLPPKPLQLPPAPPDRQSPPPSAPVPPKTPTSVPPPPQEESEGDGMRAKTPTAKSRPPSTAPNSATKPPLPPSHSRTASNSSIATPSDAIPTPPRTGPTPPPPKPPADSAVRPPVPPSPATSVRSVGSAAPPPPKPPADSAAVGARPPVPPSPATSVRSVSSAAPPPELPAANRTTPRPPPSPVPPQAPSSVSSSPAVKDAAPTSAPRPPPSSRRPSDASVASVGPKPPSARPPPPQDATPQVKPEARPPPPAVKAPTAEAPARPPPPGMKPPATEATARPPPPVAKPPSSSDVTVRPPPPTLKPATEGAPARPPPPQQAKDVDARPPPPGKGPPPSEKAPARPPPPKSGAAPPPPGHPPASPADEPPAGRPPLPPPAGGIAKPPGPRPSTAEKVLPTPPPGATPTPPAPKGGPAPPVATPPASLPGPPSSAPPRPPPGKTSAPPSMPPPPPSNASPAAGTPPPPPKPSVPPPRAPPPKTAPPPPK